MPRFAKDLHLSWAALSSLILGTFLSVLHLLRSAAFRSWEQSRASADTAMVDR